MNISHSPDSVAAPFGPYSHAVEVPGGSRLLFISGEVGVSPDGSIADSIEGQAERVWQNIVAILDSANMSIKNLVKISTYVVRPEDLPAAGAAREKYLAGTKPASTTLVVPALVRPGWLIEIEAVAAG